MQRLGKKEFVTIDEAVKELSCSSSEVRDLLDSFSIRKSEKDGRSLYFKDDLVYAKWRASLRRELEKLSRESGKGRT